MIKYKYLRLNKYKKLRYLSINNQSKICIVFLHGFMSDLEANKLGFVGLEYSGHGKSSGKFTKGNISTWSNDTKKIIKKFVKKRKVILIGSSMGSWIGLKQFKIFSNQIIGFIGIGSAPEFLELLMWKKFSKKIKTEIKTKKIYYLKSGNYEYPITYQIIRDGKKNKVLNKKILSKIKVTMIHGSKDEVVPTVYSKKVLKLFPNAKKKLVVIKNGDHSLSDKKNLKRIINELKILIFNKF
jgi:pimeloyl-ACP methyl ester carboxylesterase